MPKAHAGGDSRRVTVDDVARDAGVSQATVSQVLSGKRPVSAATRARVMASIAELGFRPNQLARALRQQKSHTVAIVVPNIAHVVYPMVARGVSELLRPLGYQAALYDTDHSPSTETQVLRTVADRMVDGAIVFGFPVKQSDAEILSSVGIPFVNGGLDESLDTQWDSVRVDQVAAISSLVEHVAALGRSPIAYIGGPTDEGSASARETGFRVGMAAARQPIDPALLTSSPYSWEGGRAALDRMLSDGHAPRSVICANDMIAIGAMTAARDHGLRIPEDIAITGYDNIDAAVMSLPPLTTVEAHPFEQGRECARLLLDRMTGDYGGRARHVMLPAKLLLRESA